jgi:hypothetical protein
MKRYFYLLGCVFILFSCESTIDDNVIVEPQDQISESKKFVISQEDAIVELNAVLSIIDSQKGNQGLRSGKQRTIKNVEILRTQVSLRSDIVGMDTLLYLVNFNDNEGFAVLAADSRIPETVLAVIDQGNITPQDFVEGDYHPYNNSVDYIEGFNLYNKDADDYYVASEPPPYTMLVHYAQYGRDDNGLSGGAVINEYVAPMLTTVWHQNSPFNNQCPAKGSGHAPAGCVPIALAQIVAYHEYPQNFSFNGYSVNWTGVKNICNTTNYDGSGTPYDSITVAQMVSFIGSWCNTLYTEDWSFAMPTSAEDFLEQIYDNVDLDWGYEEDKIIDMLKKGNPVFISAVSGLVSGHAWVIDGYIGRSTAIYTTDDLGRRIVTIAPSPYLVHCNWGWKNGNANGYYYSGIFNTKNGPDEFGANDHTYSSYNDYNPTWAFSVITYKNPNN